MDGERVLPRVESGESFEEHWKCMFEDVIEKKVEKPWEQFVLFLVKNSGAVRECAAVAE